MILYIQTNGREISMAIENNLQLISYLAAAEIYDKKKNIFDCFLPIIESALICDENKNDITFLRLQSKLYDIYNLNVPKSTLRKILFLLQEQKKIKFIDNRKIILCKDELNTAFFERRDERENLVEDFFIAFNDFLINNNINISLSEMKKRVCEWLYVHSLELAYFINNGIFTNDMLDDKDWEYSSQLIEFLLSIQGKSSDYFKTFLLLYNGAVQSSLLNFETDKINIVCSSSIQFKNIILDTNFILRMLNLQSEFDCSTAEETINILKSQNANFYILDQTLTEVQNSIKNYLNESDTYTQSTKLYFQGQQIRMTGFWEASKRGISRSTMLEKTKKDTLKKCILELIDATFIEDFDDSKILTDQIENLVNSKNRTNYGDKQAKHDLSLIEYCRKNRKNHITSVSDIDWWVLTNDERLTFWTQQSDREYQECLTEIQLCNLMWIQGKRNDNLGLTQTIVSLSANAAISYSDIEQFAKKVHIYQQKNIDNVNNLDKISLLFASNMLTTADIQKINAEEDALDQILEEKVSIIQEGQALQQQKGEKLSSENELLIQRNKILSEQLEKEKYQRKIDKYTRDIDDLKKEKNSTQNNVDIFAKLIHYKEEHNNLAGRIIIIMGLISITLIVTLYVKFGHALVLNFLSKIVTVPSFIQDTILLVIPVLLTMIYYIIIGIIFGNLFSPKELFNLLKLNLLNKWLRKYMIKNNISLKYLDIDIEISKAENDLNINALDRNIQILKSNILETKEKMMLLDNN